MIRRCLYVASLAALLMGCAENVDPASAKARKDPARPKLEARMVVNKTTYALDLGGKTAEEFQRGIEAVKPFDPLPASPAVDMVFEIVNAGENPLSVTIWDSMMQLDLKGPGVLDRQQIAMNCIPPPPLTLKPGEVHKIPIKQLGYFSGKGTHSLYWTQPGEYTLSASLSVDVAPGDAAANAPRTTLPLRSEPVKLKVEKKDTK
ncbi:hypothetical protein AYO40_01435 [Planctomycetaceae bacterium SCGC AG-212-D15]|nr:hypothetical protein AYO40_01435 [Planctomycetaceae bacterium SCGC AG-212-D15]